MAQKIKLLKPLRSFIDLPQNPVPEKFYGVREKLVTLNFTLFYVKNPGDSSFTLNEQNKRILKPGILSRLALVECHKCINCAADVIEKQLKEYVQRGAIVYMIKLSGAEIKVGLRNFWQCQPSVLIYHYELT